MHIGLAVRQEQEVSIVGTLLAANPHYPDENSIKIRDEHKLEVDDPQDEV